MQLSALCFHVREHQALLPHHTASCHCQGLAACGQLNNRLSASQPLLTLSCAAAGSLLLSVCCCQMRTSALTVVHTLSMVALGSTAPLMALGFLAQSGSLASPAFVNIIMAAVTAAAVAWQAWRSSDRLRF